MEQEIQAMKETLQLIPDLKSQFQIQRNPDGCGPLIYTGVAESNLIPKLSPLVEKYFGKAYKAAGAGAFFMNWFDSFVRNVGGVRKDQTLFRKAIADDIDLFCAFWPWGTNPIKTSIRVGIICPEEREPELEKALKGLF